MVRCWRGGEEENGKLENGLGITAEMFFSESVVCER